MSNLSRGLPSPASIGATEEVQLKPYSCLLCRQRKVKCSRTDPCRICVRSKIKCEYVAPAPARRKGSARPKEGLHARLRRYEAILRDYGEKLDSFDQEQESDDDAYDKAREKQKLENPTTKRGKLLTRKGNTRYLDSEIWTTLTKEIDDPTELFSDGSEDEAVETPSTSPYIQSYDECSLLFSTSQRNLAMQHPVPVCLEKLFEAFCVNVEPLIKIVHTPSFRKTVDKAIFDSQQLCRSDEALLFTIYLSAVFSWSEAECFATLGETREASIQKYRALAQQSFVNASLLKSTNIVTLQAYSIFLMVIRPLCDTGTLLTMSAIALRIARRIGLHRDGSYLKISPFEVEMRRRLWWTIASMEYKLAEICGCRPSADLLGDTKTATNLNDADLDPDMTVAPTERVGITDMVALMVKNYAVSGISGTNTRSAIICAPSTDMRTFEERDQAIDALQETFEQKILRYCDPLEPLHFLTSLMCRAVVCKLRVAAHSPFKYADENIPLPQAARDIVWENGRKLIEYGNLMQLSPLLARYKWMVGPHFLWDSFIYILGELRHRKFGTEVEHVWSLTAKIYEYHPLTSIDANNPNFLALGVWILRVWDETLPAREAYNGVPVLDPPYIASLRNSRRTTLARSNSAREKTSQMTCQSNATMPLGSNDHGTYAHVHESAYNAAFPDNNDIFDVPLDGFDWAQFDQVFQ